MADQYPVTRGRHLNHVAWLYDPLVERLSFGRERKFREKTMAWMDIAPTDRILDIGCGTGSLTLLLAERLDSGAGGIIGIDAAPRMIAIARGKAANKKIAAAFQVGIAESLAFADGSFDWVVNSMFTHHIDTQLKTKAFAEMYRVLRPGGMLLTADIDRPTTLLGELLGWGGRYLLLQPELADNLHGLLPDFMHRAGFRQVERKEHLYGLVSFFTATKPEGGR
ncbi:MAG: methyltransferase domain-containing protein [Deltaproteobacteria bacterium]|nr:methyltransferase domain-containing protein [Deltaproteobacteria bacterium]